MHIYTHVIRCPFHPKVISEIEVLIESELTLLLSHVLEHFVLVSLHLFDLNDELSFGLGGLCGNNVVIIAVGAELVSLLEFTDILAEYFLALLACKYHFGGSFQFVVITHGLLVALGAIKPSLAAGGADGNLGVQNMFAHFNDCLIDSNEIINYITRFKSEPNL